MSSVEINNNINSITISETITNIDTTDVVSVVQVSGDTEIVNQIGTVTVPDTISIVDTTDTVSIVQVSNTIGPQGSTGSSGVISVTAPITNTGTASAAIIGIDQTGITIAKTQVTGVAITQADTSTVTSAMLSPSVVQTFIQTTVPTVSLGSKYAWWDTSQNNLTLWIEDGT